MNQLEGFRVAVLVTDGFEEMELTEPVKALEDCGARVAIVSPRTDRIQATVRDLEPGIRIAVDRSVREVAADDYDAVLIPGGTVNADRMRTVPEVQAFLRAMQEKRKSFAVICHGPWELVSAGLVRGRTLTSYPTLRDDIVNAGGNWENQETVVDDNWVTSRAPGDIPAFNAAMIKLFASRPRQAA